jgi:NADH dehydrogenase (ubiquinone) 1 beta subcomplex subunit 7
MSGHHDELPEVSSAPGEMKVTHQEMKAARLDVSYRDACAHLLIPLNKCRHESPWTFQCGHERHEYERCLYVEVSSRERLGGDQEAEREDRVLATTSILEDGRQCRARSIDIVAFPTRNWESATSCKRLVSCVITATTMVS